MSFVKLLPVNKMVAIVSFLLALCICVFFHEGGHFLVAKVTGIGVLEFNVGIGNKIISYSDDSGTVYSLRGIPLGGYIKMCTEKTGCPNPHGILTTKHPLTKIAVSLAGPLANVIFSFLVLFLLSMWGMPVALPVVGEMIKGMPAENAGIRPGDWITTVNEIPVYSYNDYLIELRKHAPAPVQIGLVRNDEHMFVSVTPHMMPDGSPVLGFRASGVTTRTKAEPRTAMRKSADMCIEVLRSFLYLLTSIRSKGFKSLDMIGPIGSTQQSGAAVKAGGRSFMVYIAVLSLCLGACNILPLPLLDGGNIFAYVIELIIGHPMGPEALLIYNMSGILLLASILIVSTVQDLRKLQAERALKRLSKKNHP